MGLFKSGNEKMLDSVIQRLEMNLSNNYKDNAIALVNRLKRETAVAEAGGELKTKEVTELQKIIQAFETDIKSFKRTY